MAHTADTADIMANTASILAPYPHDADTSSAEAVPNSAVANREHIATGAAKTGKAVIGAAIGGIIDSPLINSSRSVDLVIRTTTGIGTLNGAFLTRLTTAIILTDIILRIGTIMIIRGAPNRERDSWDPDPWCDSL
jgi:hypothetical protein